MSKNSKVAKKNKTNYWFLAIGSITTVALIITGLVFFLPNLFKESVLLPQDKLGLKKLKELLERSIFTYKNPGQEFSSLLTKKKLILPLSLDKQYKLSNFQLQIIYTPSGATFKLLNSENKEQKNFGTFNTIAAVQELLKKGSIDETLEKLWTEEWTQSQKQTIENELNKISSNSEENNERTYTWNASIPPSMVAFSVTKVIDTEENIDINIETKITLTKSNPEATKFWESTWIISGATLTKGTKTHSLSNLNNDIAPIEKKVAQIALIEQFVAKLKNEFTSEDSLFNSQTNAFDLLDLNTNVFLSTNNPKENILTSYKLQIEHSGSKLILKLLDASNNQVYSFDQVASVDAINSDLRTTVIEKIKELWTKEWDTSEQNRLIKEIKTINHVGENELTPTIDSTTSVRTVTVSITLTSAKVPDLPLTLTIKFGPSSDSDSEAWENSWTITSVQLTSDSDTYNQEHTLNSINNINDVNTKINEILADYELDFLKTKLKTMIANIPYIASSDSEINSLVQNTPVVLNFISPTGTTPTFTNYKLSINYDGSSVVFKILNSDDEAIHTFDSISSFASIPSAATQIIEQIEKQWSAEDFEFRKKQMQTKLQKTIYFLRSIQWNVSDQTIWLADSFAIRGSTPKFSGRLPKRSFMLTITPSRDPNADAQSKPWETKLVFESFTLYFPGSAKRVRMSDFDDDQTTSLWIEKINTELVKWAYGSETRTPSAKNFWEWMKKSYKDPHRKKLTNEFEEVVRSSELSRITLANGQDKWQITLTISNQEKTTTTKYNVFFYVNTWPPEFPNEINIINVAYTARGTGTNVIQISKNPFYEKIGYDGAEFYYYLKEVVKAITSS